MARSTATLRGVVKTYGKGYLAVKALDDIDLDVMGATMTAIVGPSGSGKSTLLHVIGAMDKATEGEVEVVGVDLNTLDQKGLAKVRRKHIGFVFQTFNLIPILTAFENVTLPMEFIRKGRREKKERGEYLLKKVHLDHRLRHKPSELSGGEQQRVAIARALANDPAILLADEPTGNLDTKTGRVIYELLREIAEEKTVIVVTHDEHIAENADKVIHISDGQLHE
ncbi:MAG: ABC transporter ATP-binding protein [Syntrophobacteria bacterium]|jgi:ABC-type lipoprotein export system ATPase subunit